MSPRIGAANAAREMTPALLADLAARATVKDTQYFVSVTEPDLLDLAAGFVPRLVRAMCRTLLDMEDEDRRRAARPQPKPARRKGKK